MRVVYAPAARAEYVAVQAWYIEKRGLEQAERFNAELDRLSAAIGANPRLWAEYEPGIHRALFKNFRYALHYMIRSDHVYVLALSHQHRRPGYWRDRIPK